MSDIAHEGGCQCGAVRYAAQGAPKFVCRCHCAACRKATGGAFAVWVGFKDEQVSWSGAAPAAYQSSEGVCRRFCRQCGTPLSYAGKKWPHETHLLIGTFDQPESFSPEFDAYPESALSWAKPRGEHD